MSHLFEEIKMAKKSSGWIIVLSTLPVKREHFQETISKLQHCLKQ